MDDSYQIIASASEGLYKDKGSKFISYAYPFSRQTELEAILESLKNKHPKASHFCYAYGIGIKRNIYKFNDDGEPSGTAGKPIFGQLLSFDISDALVVVVRYFGGTKLGVSGLTQAYKLAAADALSKAEFSVKYLSSSFRIYFDYADTGRVMNILKKSGASIKEKHLEETFFIDFEIRVSKIKPTIIQIKAGLLECSHEEAAMHGDDFLNFKVEKIS
jgi:uncharacterized YigZ family protein